MKDEPMELPFEEQKATALEFYEEMSNSARMYSSFIKEAIKGYNPKQAKQLKKAREDLEHMTKLYHGRLTMSNKDFDAGFQTGFKEGKVGKSVPNIKEVYDILNKAVRDGKSKILIVQELEKYFIKTKYGPFLFP